MQRLISIRIELNIIYNIFHNNLTHIAKIDKIVRNDNYYRFKSL